MTCAAGSNEGPATIGVVGGVESFSRTSRTELVVRAAGVACASSVNSYVASTCSLLDDGRLGP